MVAPLVKGLKPKKLAIDDVRKNLLNALRSEGRIVKKEFEKTTRTWKGAKPTFEVAIGLTQTDAIVIIGPAGSTEGAQKWVWLDEGTKPHTIRAKNPRIVKRKGKTVTLPPMLVFRHGSGFTPKTKVKTFSSGAGANTGDWQSKKKVQHPGTDAREWSKEIVKRRRKRFTQAMIKAARV